MNIPPANAKRKRKSLQLSNTIRSHASSSNTESVNVVGQDMTSSTIVPGDTLPSSVSRSSKVRNKSSRIDRRKYAPQDLLNNTTARRAKERNEYQCKSFGQGEEPQEDISNGYERRKAESQDKPEKEANSSIESVISSVCESSDKLDKDKKLRSSKERVIRTVCDGSNKASEQEPSGSTLSYISQKSSSSGRGSRMSCRSNSSCSLPSPQLEKAHNQEQRRRISIQNEDVPHIRNKDTISKPIKPKVSLVTSQMKKKKQSTSKLLKTVGEKMLLSPLKLGSKLAHGTFCNSPFITPAARVKIKLACKSKLTARVKRLATNHKQVGVNRKSSASVKSRAIAFNSSVTSIAVEQPPTVEQECGGNVTKKLQSNKRKFSETCSSKGYPCLHIHTQDPMPTTSVL